MGRLTFAVRSEAKHTPRRKGRFLSRIRTGGRERCWRVCPRACASAESSVSTQCALRGGKDEPARPFSA